MIKLCYKYIYIFQFLKRIEIFTQKCHFTKHANLPILFTSGSLFLQFLYFRTFLQQLFSFFKFLVCIVWYNSSHGGGKEHVRNLSKIRTI